ncbi:MAG: DNRLRE domain-containing protein, partial [Planctomycetota bacterium]
MPGEGKRRAVISVQAQNYQRADGSWAPIVEELAAADQSSGMDFDCLENGLQSQFGRVNGLPMVRVNTIGNAPVSMVPAGMVARRADGSVIEQTAPNATVATRVGLRTVEYRNLYPGAIDQYIAVAERVKHSLVLDAAALQLPAGTAWIGGTYRFTLPAGYALQTASGDAISGSTVVERGLQIVDADGNAVYQILPVWVYDASGASIEGRYSVTVNDDATIDITMEADAAWATDPARVLPIEIDPTLTAQPDPAAGKDAYIRQAAPASNYGNDQHLGANYGVPNQWLICWVQYDVSPIPSDSTVDAARYEWYHWGNTATNETLSAHLVTAGWTETGVTWNNQPAYDNNNLT